jgi:archaetidylinositol phosphate synthase
MSSSPHDPGRPPGFREARREQFSLLARAEKRVLVWLAHRTPDWINPDHLTVLGLASMFFAGACYALTAYDPYFLLGVNFFLIANWWGDSLDGTLARVRNAQRPRYGFYVDHIVDAFGTLFLLTGLGLSSYMHPMLAAALLVSYFLLTIQSYLSTYCLGAFQMSFWGFGPTELRLLLIAGNIALLIHPMSNLFGYEFPLFDVGGAIGAVSMTVAAVVAAIRNTITLYRAEPPAAG